MTFPSEEILYGIFSGALVWFVFQYVYFKREHRRIKIYPVRRGKDLELSSGNRMCGVCYDLYNAIHICPLAVIGDCANCGTVELDRYGMCDRGHTEISGRRMPNRMTT